MTPETSLAPAELLVELHRLGVRAAIKCDALSLRPATRVSPSLLEAVRVSKAEIMALLADPRRRWRVQAEAVIGKVEGRDLRQDLLDVFDEREAIASVDGGMGDDAAGQLAYETLLQELGKKGG